MNKWVGLKRRIITLVLASLLISFISVHPAQAAIVIATGTNPTACNQTVDNASNVVAYRLSGGDCVVEFKNVGTVNLTISSGVTSVQVLTVGGGGGGGGGSRVNTDGYRGSGGGGEGGEARYAASYSVTAGASAAVIVGNDGTSGTANNAAGGFGSIGNTGGASSFNGANSAAGGVGGGVMSAENQLQSGGDGGGLIGSCNSSTVQSSTGSSNNYFSGCNDYEGSGGGAGSGGNGGNGSDIGGPGGNGGAGGVGLSYLITDTLTFFGGGGGGGGTSGSISSLNGSAGAGGNGGGGGGSIYGSPSPATSGTANRGGGGGGGAGYSNATQVATSGGAGGIGIVIIRYTPVIDTTAPTFTSTSTFSVSENIAISATAATIRVSESATVTISSGADSTLFNIYFSDSTTAQIKFKVSPDFEAPTDSGGNNVYDLTLTATDSAGNAGTQAITISVTNVVESSVFSLFQLAGAATTATFRSAVVVSATVNVESRITFTLNGKPLPGCKSKLATGSASSFTTTCVWKPSNRGQVTLTAAASPTSAGIAGSNSSPLGIRVGNRTGART